MESPVTGSLWVKRGLDLVLCLLLALPAGLAVLAAMALVRLTSRGPALYTQTRIGYRGQPFTIYKIRSMIHNCESLTGPRWCVPGDPRVTPVGSVLRKLHIDELPQLWNILRGDMSLVGPRPERPEFVRKLSREIPHYQARHAVYPGITGLAQIQLPPDTEVAHVQRKLTYDLHYVRHLGLGLDLRILLGTALKMVGAPTRVLAFLVGRREEAMLAEPVHLAFPKAAPRSRAA